MTWVWIRVSGLKNGGRKTPRNVPTQTSRERNQTILMQGPLQAAGWKKDEGTEGDPASSTRPEARQPRGARGTEILVLELSFLAALSAALAWHTQAGPAPGPKEGSAEANSCGC